MPRYGGCKSIYAFPGPIKYFISSYLVIVWLFVEIAYLAPCCSFLMGTVLSPPQTRLERLRTWPTRPVFVAENVSKTVNPNYGQVELTCQ